MGLEYMDLFLAHWPHAYKPISREALEKAKGGPQASDEEKAILIGEGGKPVKDWEHSSRNIARQKGVLPFLNLFSRPRGEGRLSH